MTVRVAESAGFCFGIECAVKTVYEQLEKKIPVYTFGPITHNEIVCSELEKKGVRIINDVSEADGISDSVIIIRSHGVSREAYLRLKETEEGRHNTIIDATCPFVGRIHKIVSEESEKGSSIIVVGDASHPEVQGISGWCRGRCTIIDSEEEALNYSPENDERTVLVAQTTYNLKKFKVLVEILQKKIYNINVVNSICNATEKRQRETSELAAVSDAMIVIGGSNSSNTRKLVEISEKECKNTYHIQTGKDLDLKSFRSFRCVGITAGASTPKTIIREVQEIMSEMNFDAMLDESMKTIHNGEVVEGKVIYVKEDEIALDIGYKADGIIPRSEYTNTPNLDLRTVVKEGDTIQAKVLKVNDGEGQVSLTYKRLAAERGSEKLAKAFEDKEVLKAKVTEVLGGGICVVYDEARVFIPASLVSDTYEKNLDKYKDQEIEFVVTEFQPKKRRIIGDRKQILVARKAEAMKKLFDTIKVGDVIEGTVKNITDFGAFIDLGGADGLLHISEMSWGRVESPKKVFKVGETVRAFIKDIQGNKVALSMKFPDQNPWADAEEKFAVGNVVTGKVARMTDFGAFVELLPGVDALLHVSQISRDHIEKPSDVLKAGQEITAKIVDFNLEEKKISLSIKALLPPKENETEGAAENTTGTEAAEESESVSAE
ncbi:MAG: bifunctional 4-hydroxy-3-methylbut-2-enyl diphosphate reductase/30S ribosomal protein S1 [Lachnospiraceae bacterium]|nr:bifunctional 4-hydroxy-3-methylbut-2-enyl diphosphate reductase/30S ribosomal protein S1 [Lachnospiraceae bacterium]